MVDSEKPNSSLRYLGVGIELGGTVSIMALLGYGIDRWLESAPWAILIASTIGIVGGLYNLIKKATQSNKIKSSSKDK